MTSHKDTGIIKTGAPIKTDEVPIEWRIHRFSSVIETKDPDTCYDSPAFLVNGASWFLRFYPRARANPEFSRVYIKTKEIREYVILYNFSLKKWDGSMEQLGSGVLEGNKTYSDVQDIKRSEILQRKSELIAKDVITLICRLRFGSIHVIPPTESDETTIMDETTFMDETKAIRLTRLDKLSDNFKDLYDDKETCDVLLKVMEKEYKAHKTVLIARSSVFAATFKHDTLERQTGVITIPDCDPDSFQEFLCYLYSGKLGELSFSGAKSLYYISDKYDVKEVKEFCMEYLMQCLTLENVCEVVVFSDTYEETKLYKAAQNFFIENSFEILLTSEWEHLLKNNYRLGNKLLTEMAKLQLKK